MGLALFFYLQPLWSQVDPLQSVNKGLLFTGVPISFSSLMPVKSTLKPNLKKLLLWILLPMTLGMFLLALYWLFAFEVVPEFAASLIVLAIGMLSIIKMIVD